MRQHAFRLLADDHGRVVVEYGMILALLAVLLIAAIGALRAGFESVLGKATSCMRNAVEDQGC